MNHFSGITNDSPDCAISENSMAVPNLSPNSPILISDSSFSEDELEAELARIHNTSTANSNLNSEKIEKSPIEASKSDNMNSNLSSENIEKSPTKASKSDKMNSSRPIVILQSRSIKKANMSRDTFQSKVESIISSGGSPDASQSSGCPVNPTSQLPVTLPFPQKKIGPMSSCLRYGAALPSNMNFYIEEDSPERQCADGKSTGNANTTVEEILNNDISVFLSSQITRLVNHEWRTADEVVVKKMRKHEEPKFKYAKPTVQDNDDNPEHAAKWCTYSKLVNLKVNQFGKATGWFHLYQYNLYNAPIDHDQLPVMFNLSNDHWRALESIFKILPNYEFSNTRRVERSTIQLQTFEKGLDLHLTSLSQINSCYITFKDGVPDQFFLKHNLKKKIDNTDAIDPYILDTMKKP